MPVSGFELWTKNVTHRPPQDVRGEDLEAAVAQGGSRLVPVCKLGFFETRVIAHLLSCTDSSSRNSICPPSVRLLQYGSSRHDRRRIGVIGTPSAATRGDTTPEVDEASRLEDIRGDYCGTMLRRLQRVSR